MEGNYRIVQLSDNEFVIEKEVVKVITYPWYRFKKKSYKSNWRKLVIKGNTVGFYSWNQEKPFYKASDLKMCQDRLRQILKYPAIIEYAKV